ncbi:MAG: hypothetical protein Q8R36_03990 [bacterium]|nr:hypothetical protein [bacterium]
MHLSERWIQALAAVSETGMGYQVVDVHLHNGRVLERVIVLNSEELLIPLELTISENDIKDIVLSKNL